MLKINGKKVNGKIFNTKNSLFCLLAVFSSIKNTKAVFYSLRRAVIDWGVPHWKYKNGPIDVILKVDDEMPLKECTGVYMSYLVYPAGVVGFINREFGRRKAREDTTKFFNDFANLYITSGTVYRHTQTTMIKPEGGGLAIRIIKKLVPPNCMFPSLHVQITCHALFNADRVIKKYTNGKDYRQYQHWLHSQAVDIIESCLISKQHALADISAGFFAYGAVTEGFKESGMVESIIKDMFKKLEKTGEMSKESANKARKGIEQIYKELFTAYKNSNKEHTQILLDYINKL